MIITYMDTKLVAIMAVSLGISFSLWFMVMLKKLRPLLFRSSRTQTVQSKQQCCRSNWLMAVFWMAYQAKTHNGIMAQFCLNFCELADYCGRSILNSVTRLGDLLDFRQVFKTFATIDLPISPTFLGNFCKGVKINHFCSEIIFGQLL